MADVITLDEAKSHLRISNAQEDGDIYSKLVAAQQVIVDYLTRRAGDGDDWNAEMAAWTSETIPASVRAAILVQLGELYRKRGDDQEVETDKPVGLSPTVSALLMRYRDPGVA